MSLPVLNSGQSVTQTFISRFVSNWRSWAKTRLIQWRQQENWCDWPDTGQLLRGWTGGWVTTQKGLSSAITCLSTCKQGVSLYASWRKTFCSWLPSWHLLYLFTEYWTYTVSLLLWQELPACPLWRQATFLLLHRLSRTTATITTQLVTCQVGFT